MKNKKHINITPKFIKSHLEKITGYDLSIKSRARHIVDIRRVAFKLSRVLTDNSLTSIGEIYDKDHASVLHGIKTFDELYESPGFREYKKLYRIAYTDFMKIRKKIDYKKTIMNLEEAHIYYEQKIEKLIEEHDEIVSSLMAKNERFKTNPIFSKIAELPEQEFEELEIRVNAFLQMNGMNSERRKLRKQRELEKRDI